MDNIWSASQSPKKTEYGRPKTSSENGFLAMKSSHPSSEPSIASNQASIEVTPYSKAAIEQPSQLVIDKNWLFVDAVNQMDLDKLADAENVDIGLSEWKSLWLHLKFEPVLEDNSNDLDTVEDDVSIIMLYFRFQISSIKAICCHVDIW